MFRDHRSRVGFPAIGLLLLSGAAFGQADKPKPKPLATPPILTAAEIISRAEDYREPVPATVGVAEKSQEPVASDSELIKQLNERIKKLESEKKVDKDEKQKRLLLNLDILSRAEQRSESLRKQMFEMIEKENVVKGRLEQIELDIRPEVIERALQLTGSMRPEDVRDARRKSLAAERANLQSLLTEVQSTRANLSVNLQKSEAVVEKLRTKLEKDIDDSLNDESDG